MSGSISGIESRVVASVLPEIKRTRNDASSYSTTDERIERARAPVVEKTVRKVYPRTERSRASAEFRVKTLEEALERRKKQARETGFSLNFEFLWETEKNGERKVNSLVASIFENGDGDGNSSAGRDHRTVVRVIPAADIERFVELALEGEPSGSLFEIFL